MEPFALLFAPLLACQPPNVGQQAKSCATDADCSGTLCVNAKCESATSSQQGTITSVVGDSVSAPGRIKSGLIVSGTHLDTTTAARLLSSAGTVIADLMIGTASASTVHATIPLAAHAAIGASVGTALTLELLTAHGVARQAVQILQGETGPPGINGAPGATGAPGTAGGDVTDVTGSDGISVTNGVGPSPNVTLATSVTRTSGVSPAFTIANTDGPGLEVQGDSGADGTLNITEMGDDYARIALKNGNSTPSGPFWHIAAYSPAMLNSDAELNFWYQPLPGADGYDVIKVRGGVTVDNAEVAVWAPLRVAGRAKLPTYRCKVNVNSDTIVTSEPGMPCTLSVTAERRLACGAGDENLSGGCVARPGSSLVENQFSFGSWACADNAAGGLSNLDGPGVSVHCLKSFNP